MMPPTVHYDADLCIMTRFSALISGKWKPIILHLIEKDICRFSRMIQHMPSVSKKVLTEQLRELEADGLIRRVELKTKAPKIVIYGLTEKGASLRKLIDAMIAWSMQYLHEEIPRELADIFMQESPHISQPRQHT